MFLGQKSSVQCTSGEPRREGRGQTLLRRGDLAETPDDRLSAGRVHQLDHSPRHLFCRIDGRRGTQLPSAAWWNSGVSMTEGSTVQTWIPGSSSNS
jgi:hypothetical protein